MKAVCLHDKDRIEAFLRRNTFLHIYELGDLDDRLWGYTTWHALTNGDELKAIALIYSGLSLPTLLAMGDDNEVPMVQELLRGIVHLLPRRFYSHLSIGLVDTFANHYRLDPRGKHYKMALTDTSKLDNLDTSVVVQLSATDANELLDFYRQTYPGHWFDPSMLDIGQYFGVRIGSALVSVAGVHVCSEQYKVAALGNIATHPAHRRHGYAEAAIAALCKNLLKTVQHVGLNVKADNHPAIACYHRLGFQIAGAYEECDVNLL